MYSIFQHHLFRKNLKASALFSNFVFVALTGSVVAKSTFSLEYIKKFHRTIRGKTISLILQHCIGGFKIRVTIASPLGVRVSVNPDS